MSIQMTRRSLALLLASASTGARAAASGLPAPTGTPILTVSGKIQVSNHGNAARFDRAMLEALGLSSFTTRTPWYDRPVHFEGVLMSRLMKAVGAGGDTVTAVALNDYSTDIPISDFERYGTLLALKRDGAYMPVNDKGPLFIVYPFDSNPDLRNRRFYSRSAWQVAELIVK